MPLTFQQIQKTEQEANFYKKEANRLNNPLGIFAETIKGIPRELGKRFKSGLKKIQLTLPNEEDFNNLKSNDQEIKQKAKDRIIAGSMIFSPASLEAKAPQVVKQLEQSPVVKKLINIIKSAKPAQKELQQLQTVERAKRTGAVAGVLEKAEGEKGYYQALSKLKGELVPEAKRPRFEPIRIPKEERPLKTPMAEIPQELFERKMNLSFLKETINTHPAKNLSSFVNRRGEFAGELQEVTGKGKGIFARKGDDIVTEFGFPDSETARKSYQELKLLKQQADDMSKKIIESEKGFKVSDKARREIEDYLNELAVKEELRLTQTDVDELFKVVQQHPNLDVYEKLNTSSGLIKLFQGEIPQKHELSLLEDTFGSDLIKTIMTKRTLGQKIGNMAVDILNIPRSLMTSFDMSAPLRQGILFTTTKPLISIPAFGTMFKQFFSEKAFKGWIDNVKITPEYKLIKQSKLYISDPTKISEGISAREEAFMSNLAERIPLIGLIVKASGRAYTGFLNKMRVDVFNNLSKKLIEDGIDPKTEQQIFTDLADYVNNATGRGSLGKMNRAGAFLNNIFFSPRLVAARFNMLNPVWYASKAPQVRKEAIKNFAKFIGFGMTVLAISKAGGADVEDDLRSTDFGKIRVGNTRWDIWGGFQQWVRVFSQVISGQRKTARGDIVELSKKKFPYETRLDVIGRFARGKLAPMPSLALELAEGQKLFGEELEWDTEALNKIVPLYLQDMDEAIREFGASAIFTTGVPAFFGVGVQTYEEKQKAGNPFNI